MLNVPSTLLLWSLSNGHVLPKIRLDSYTRDARREEYFAHIPLPLFQQKLIHGQKCFYKNRVLTTKLAQATTAVPPSSSSVVLDDGCGLGTVTAEVKKSFPDLPVIAIDSAAGMLKALHRKAKKHDWKNVETKLLDGGELTGKPSSP